MPLKPLKEYEGASYPSRGRRLLGGLLAAAALGATTLGGCGPTIDSHTLDSALDSGDLDATARDCGADGGRAECGPGPDR